MTPIQINKTSWHYFFVETALKFLSRNFSQVKSICQYVQHFFIGGLIVIVFTVGMGVFLGGIAQLIIGAYYVYHGQVLAPYVASAFAAIILGVILYAVLVGAWSATRVAQLDWWEKIPLWTNRNTTNSSTFALIKRYYQCVRDRMCVPIDLVD